MRMMDQGHHRIMVLTQKPANEASPTKAELDGGIGLLNSASCAIPKASWRWTHADDKAEADTSMCDTAEVESPTEAAYDLAIGVYREFDASGKPDATAEALLAALQKMGTELWIYVRRTGQLSTDPVADADEIYLGGRVQVGSLKTVDGGNQKFEAKLYPQRMFDWIKVAAGA